MSEQKQALKKRGIVLATAGLLLALSVALALRLLGVSDAGYGGLLIALAVTFAVQFLLWLLPHRGWEARLTWDPHYLYLPMVAAAFLLNLYGYIVPSARYLLLMAWFVALLFMAGLVGHSAVVVLSGIMAILYLGVGALLVERGVLVSLAFEAIVVGVFFAICVYAGLVFNRLRRQRREMLALRRELAELALRDPLTGLPNRRFFEDQLREELARVARYGGPCSVAMVDVDNFKEYNDALGHVAGDRVLRELARLLAENTRETDVAARFGGEEFALILVQTPIEKAWDVVERLRRNVERHAFPNEDVLPGGRLTISAGVATASEKAVPPEELVEKADEALYAAKSAGRNRVHLAA